MKIAPKHSREADRIADLYSHEILDTEAEPKFDYIAQLASAICGTPVGLVSLVDNDRQWFKAKVGIDATETPRDISFCSHAILQEDVFEVSNALEDERFSDNPIVADGLKVRFYAGAPLVSHKGLPLGTLCVVGNEPKKLTDEQRVLLKALASQVVDVMELRMKNSLLLKANTEIKLRQEQLLSMAKEHFMSSLVSGVIEKLDLPLKELTEVIECENNPELRRPLETIKAIFGSLEKMAKWENTSEREFFDLSEVTETLSWLTKSYCEKRKIKMVSQVPKGSRVKGSQLQLSQVFMHLFKNAASALESVGTTEKTISIQLSESHAGFVIKFVDNGSGIDEQKRASLFRPFTTGKNSEHPGLGLYLVKSLMIENGGDVFFEEKSQHTTFTLRLPSAA